MGCPGEKRGEVATLTYSLACADVKTTCKGSVVDPSPIVAKQMALCLRTDLTKPLTVMKPLTVTMSD